MSRIELTDTTADAVVKLAEGNFGAVRILTEMLRDASIIDPDDAMGGLGPLLSLDTLEIYGPRIWMLYKDVCGKNLSYTIGLLRAQQLGFIDSAAALGRAIDGHGEGLNLGELLASVKARLPNFKLTPEIATVAQEVELEAERAE